VLGEQRIFGDYDARDGVDVVRAQSIETRLDIFRADAFRCADILRDFYFRRIEQTAGVVLTSTTNALISVESASRTSCASFCSIQKPTR